MDERKSQHGDRNSEKVIDISSRFRARERQIGEPAQGTDRELLLGADYYSKPVFLEDVPQVEIIHPALDFVRGMLLTGVPNARSALEKAAQVWMVTSERELFPMIPAEMHGRNLHPKVCCGTLSVQPRYSGAVVKAFSEGRLSGDLRGTLDRVKGLLEDCVDLMDDDTYTFLTTWIIGTYMFPVFNAFPYIHFHGPKGVGKTTSLEVLSQLCFNGHLTPLVSPAAQFRLIQACRPTLLIDETENLARKTLNENRVIFLHGYAKGGEVLRAERVGTTWTQVPYEVYCPRAYASQEGFEETLGSRTVRIQMTRTRRMRPRLDRDTVQEVRDACFLASLSYAPEVHDIYNSLSDPQGVLPLFGRDYELHLPALAIATATGDPGMVESVTDFALKSHRRRQAELYESSAEHAFLGFLLEFVVKDGEYPGPVLLQAFQQFIGDNAVALDRKWTQQLQGTMLSSLGLVDRGDKRRIARNRNRTYSLSRKKLEEVALNYNLV